MSAVNLVALFVLALPVACIAWTVTHEEIFREPREWCAARSKSARRLVVRKFYYVFTCEYCFSHFVTVVLLAVTRYRLLFDDWRGYAIAGFSLVWIANVYMSLFGRLRLDIKFEGVEIAAEQETLVSRKATGLPREPDKADANASRAAEGRRPSGRIVGWVSQSGTCLIQPVLWESSGSACIHAQRLVVDTGAVRETPD